ncbi:hypothetical protein VC83_08205 [Pseudogymnoascus destructans]|uniref:Uncharacterized protein n=1 Tax=Pseudogymnoascus destructans TaxID=655981 RepID=A0A177A2K5_9PEZI|nr:uncharacterized protein VC83_08205 [Pseudogymnoascus destructans]OAF55323.1 hypothetical protein VC83_08205 [Pseudogymnoascus destructans]
MLGEGRRERRDESVSINLYKLYGTHCALGDLTGFAHSACDEHIRHDALSLCTGSDFDATRMRAAFIPEWAIRRNGDKMRGSGGSVMGKLGTWMAEAQGWALASAWLGCLCFVLVKGRHLAYSAPKPKPQTDTHDG